ncbi:MAG: hypothetical protein ACRD7E_30020, partial [Bryobacteraceae bacterium]
MKIKSYFADTLAEAMDRARQELGPDAVIVTTRKTHPESKQTGRYEVVCGTLDGSGSAASVPRSQTQTGAAPAAGQRTSSVQLGENLERLRKQMADVRQSFAEKRSDASPTAGNTGALGDLHSRLLASG